MFSGTYLEKLLSKKFEEIKNIINTFIHNNDYFSNNNFLFCKLVSKFVIIMTNNFWSLKLVVNKIFSCCDSLKRVLKVARWKQLF